MDSISTNQTIWQDIFGVSNTVAFQTFIPTLITLFVFISGILINQFIKNHNEKKRLIDLRTYFHSQIVSLVLAVDKQKEHIGDFITQLKVDEIISWEFSLSVDFSINHLKRIQEEELFKIFVVKEKKEKDKRIKLFNTLLQQLDLIDGLRDSFKTSFDYITRNAKEYQETWNHYIDIIGDQRDSYLAAVNANLINPAKDSFVNEFLITYFEWSKNDNYLDMYVAEINPIDKLIEHIRTFANEPRGMALNGALLRCKDAVGNHKNLRQFKIKEFKSFENQLAKISSQLTETISEYKRIQNY